jgi:hypothetical protein
MQAVESQNLILYHTDLAGQWPEEAARSLLAALPYLRRLALGRGGDAARASLAGTALALRALSELLGRRVNAAEIVCAQGEKPRLVLPARLAVASGGAAGARALPGATMPGTEPDFSISHSGPWVACAAIGDGRVGLDLEVGTGDRVAQWVVREALLKATGEGLRAASEVRDIEVPESVRAIDVPESAAQQACVRWRGELWYLRRLDFFPGTSACVLTNRAVSHLAAHHIPLAELFAL